MPFSQLNEFLGKLPADERWQLFYSRTAQMAVLLNKFLMIVQTDGPLVYIDDDEDDQLLFVQAIRELGLSNSVHLFSNGLTALEYLETTEEKPLLILCDLSMPVMTGLELQEAIDSNQYLRMKSIPFLFFTTAAGPDLVRKAYEGNIQGFHIKASVFTDLKEQLQLIVTYWKSCLHPNSFQ